MSKVTPHIAIILRDFHEFADRNRQWSGFLPDSTFVLMLESFNCQYRDDGDWISEEVLMDVMCKSDTYRFDRCATGWTIVEVKEPVRYKLTFWKDKYGGAYNEILDTHTRKSTPVPSYTNGECVTKMLNEDFTVYDKLVLNYVMTP